MTQYDTQATQDAHLADAQGMAPAGIRVDRCRHHSVHLTSLWVFKDGHQIGVVARREHGGWRGQRMHHGMPTDNPPPFDGMAEAFNHVCG